MPNLQDELRLNCLMQEIADIARVNYQDLGSINITFPDRENTTVNLNIAISTRKPFGLGEHGGFDI